MIKIKNNTASMMVLESVIFAIMILLALILITSLSPVKKSTVDSYSNQLKIIADDSIRSLDSLKTSNRISEELSGVLFGSRLVEYISLNDTTNATEYFDKSLPDNVEYNIYISNNEKTILWYGGEAGIGKLGDVSRSEYLLVIPYVFNESFGGYKNESIIPGYNGVDYIFILEVWEIL